MTGKQDRVILEGSEKSVFIYRIDGGMDDRDRDEIESMDSGYVLGRNWPSIVSDSVDLHHRMNYIRNRNLGFCYLGIQDEGFRKMLESIDTDLPATLGFIVADFYRNGTQRLTDLLENTDRRNPAGLKKVLDDRPYRRMVMAFLDSISDMKINPDDCFLEKIPADRFECASISGDKQNGYTTKLVLKIVVKPSIKA